jgi:hypothetical protein
MFNKTFQALANEAEFTKEILGSGATQIRRANYASKGIYFQSFTSLPTGFERIGKPCLMLDYYIKNNGNFPNLQYMKKVIVAHSLLHLPVFILYKFHYFNPCIMYILYKD